jgi:transglutaminase-like putative cysteine protease
MRPRQFLQFCFFLAICVITSNCSAASKPKIIPSLFVMERSITDYHVNADATSIQIDELQILVKDQLVVDSLTTAEISFNSEYEKVEVLEAYTILPSGEKLMVEPKAIRLVDVDTDANSTHFSEYKKYTIIFPQVGPGARTYYKTKTISHKTILPRFFDARFAFSPEMEYGFAEITLSHDPAIKIYSDSRNVPGGRIADGPDGRIRYRYTFSQLHRLAKELSQVGLSDFAPMVAFSSFQTPFVMGDVLEDLYAPKLVVTPKVQQMADEITTGITDKMAQARALYNWVNKNIRYIALFLGDGGLVAHDAESILNNRYGDCKDHNVLLIALLAAKGIHAISASINLGGNYEAPTLGTVSPFNHEITYIPDWDLYLDSTQDLLPFGVLVGSESDKPTLLAALRKIGRTPNSSADKNRTVTYSKISIAKDGQVTGSARAEYFGEHEYSARRRFEGYKGQGKETMVRNHLNNFNEAGTGTYEPSDVYDLDTPFVVSSEFSIASMSNFPGPGAMTLPMGLAPGILTIRGYANPDFYATTPFVCSSYAYEEQYELNFDPEIKISRIPTGISYRLKSEGSEMEYTSSYSREGQTIRVTRSLRSQQPGRVCQPDRMADFEALYKINRQDILSQIFYE